MNTEQLKKIEEIYKNCKSMLGKVETNGSGQHQPVYVKCEDVKRELLPHLISSDEKKTNNHPYRYGKSTYGFGKLIETALENRVGLYATAKGNVILISEHEYEKLKATKSHDEIKREVNKGFIYDGYEGFREVEIIAERADGGAFLIKYSNGLECIVERDIEKSKIYLTQSKEGGE